jgi:CTP:molybdopterin cytidylyltransferase MocA
VLGVLGAGASQIRSAGIHGIDAFVENPAFQAGRTGSIQSGLAAVPAGWGALIWPVDVPFVEAKTVRALVAAAEHETVAIWFTPTFDGRGGHPIALAPEAIRQAGVIPEGVPFRDSPFRKGLGELRVPVTDPGVLDNTNTPAEWSRAERAWRDRSGS